MHPRMAWCNVISLCDVIHTHSHVVTASVYLTFISCSFTLAQQNSSTLVVRHWLQTSGESTILPNCAIKYRLFLEKGVASKVEVYVVWTWCCFVSARVFSVSFQHTEMWLVYGTPSTCKQHHGCVDPFVALDSNGIAKRFSPPRISHHKRSASTLSDDGEKEVSALITFRVMVWLCAGVYVGMRKWAFMVPVVDYWKRTKNLENATRCKTRPDSPEKHIDRRTGGGSDVKCPMYAGSSWYWPHVINSKYLKQLLVLELWKTWRIILVPVSTVKILATFWYFLRQSSATLMGAVFPALLQDMHES